MDAADTGRQIERAVADARPETRAIGPLTPDTLMPS